MPSAPVSVDADQTHGACSRGDKQPRRSSSYGSTSDHGGSAPFDMLSDGEQYEYEERLRLLQRAGSPPVPRQTRRRTPGHSDRGLHESVFPTDGPGRHAQPCDHSATEVSTRLTRNLVDTLAKTAKLSRVDGPPSKRRRTALPTMELVQEFTHSKAAAQSSARTHPEPPPRARVPRRTAIVSSRSARAPAGPLPTVESDSNTDVDEVCSPQSPLVMPTLRHNSSSSAAAAMPVSPNLMSPPSYVNYPALFLESSFCVTLAFLSPWTYHLMVLVTRWTEAAH